MPIDDSLARSHSLTSRLKPNPSTPKMNGGHHHSRFGLKNSKETITNENKPPTSTPGSPSSSSGHNSAITVAERRQTKVSKYLVSEDFKSDFATKLNRLRQREKNMDAPGVIVQTAAVDHDQPIHEDDESQDTDNNTTTPDDTTATTTATAYTADDIINPTESSELPQIPQTASPGRYRTRAEEAPIQEAEEDGYASSTSNQKERPSSRQPSFLPGEEDPEEQSARYEVISKLADQLAEQIEENDSLLYELGVVRSNNARLQAVAADKEDEVACLNQRNRQLEHIITQAHASHSAEPAKDYRQLVQVLLSQLGHIRDHLCQPLPQDTSKRHSPCIPSQVEKIRHLRRYSWSGARAKCLPDYHDESVRESACAEKNKEDLKEPSGQDLVAGWTGFVDQNDRESMKAHIHWLQAELADSRSARLATNTALQTLIESIGHQHPHDGEPSAAIQVQGLGLFSSSTPDRALRPRDTHAAETPSRGAGVDEPPSTSSPLLALASFGFGGWGRKPEVLSPPKPTMMADEDGPGIPSSHPAGSLLEQQQSPAAPEKEPAYPFKRFGLRNFFNGSPLSKPDTPLAPSPIVPLSSTPGEASPRRLPNRSSTVAVMSSFHQQHPDIPAYENALPHDLLADQNNDSPTRSSHPSSRHLAAAGGEPKRPFLGADASLIPDGPANPNAILV